MVDRRQKIVNTFASRLVMGLLIAVMSIFSAVCSYGNVILDSKASIIFSQAQEKLAFADSEYLSSNQEILQDENIYDGYSIALLQGQKEIADYYRKKFSDELQSSFDRPGGPLDAIYYNNMVARAEEGTDDALASFKRANEMDDASDRYAQGMLIFSIGLSLAAWGSLFDNHPEVRASFCIMALALLIFGMVLFFSIPFSFLTA